MGMAFDIVEARGYLTKVPLEGRRLTTTAKEMGEEDVVSVSL